MKVLLALTLLCAGELAAEVQTVAALSSPLEDRGAGARAAVLGGAFVGLADDASAIAWNPAGLAGLKGAELGLHHNSWLGESLQEIGALALPLGSAGVLGVSLSFLDFGSFQGYDDTGASTGSYGASRLGAGLAFARAWGGLGLGLAIKGQQQSIAGQSLSAFGADLGALWSVAPSLKLGLAYANLGTGLGGSSAASSLRLGASTRLDFGQGKGLALAAGGAWQPQGVSRLDLGAEGQVSVLRLRAGYQMSLADSQTEGLRGLGLGLGADLGGFKVDYAYQPYGELGSAQRVSLGYDFGAEATPTGREAPAGGMALGLALEKKGQIQAALKAYRKVAEQEPKNAAAWKAMARLYLKAGRKDYAAQCLRQAMKYAPDDREAAKLMKEAQP